MKSATLNLSKSLTMIEEAGKTCAVTLLQLGAFKHVISGLNVVQFTGCAKAAKFAKYEKMLLTAGFEVETVNYNHCAGFEGANADVFNFSITYKKA